MTIRRRLLPLLLTAAGFVSPVPALADNWQYTGVDQFSFPDGLYRSQGVTTDGTRWYFSWVYGLERTALDYGSPVRNFSVLWRRSGIPAAIADQGGNHIGDIDHDAGKIYAPIEDGPRYQHPIIAVYDAATLRYTGVSYSLPQGDLTLGVPWVAVDGPGNLAYTAEWDPAARLNLYRLNDFTPLGYLPLKQPIARLQGAKVLGDFLYAASDNATKSIYRISRRDGSVAEVLQLSRFHDLQDGYEHELQGLSFRTDAGGLSLNVLMTHGSQRQPIGARTMFFHFAPVAPAP